VGRFSGIGLVLLADSDSERARPSVERHALELPNLAVEAERDGVPVEALEVEASGVKFRDVGRLPLEDALFEILGDRLAGRESLDDGDLQQAVLGVGLSALLGELAGVTDQNRLGLARPLAFFDLTALVTLSLSRRRFRW
jgi:hypothetical protein